MSSSESRFRTRWVGVTERMKSEDFQHIAIVASLQRETGGNTAEVVDLVAETVRERIEIRRMVRGLTAQGRLSGGVLSMLPVGLLILISLLNPVYVHPLFHSTAGSRSALGCWTRAGHPRRPGHAQDRRRSRSEQACTSTSSLQRSASALPCRGTTAPSTAAAVRPSSVSNAISITASGGMRCVDRRQRLPRERAASRAPSRRSPRGSGASSRGGSPPSAKRRSASS